MQKFFNRSVSFATSIVGLITGSLSLAAEGRINEDHEAFHDSKFVDSLLENGIFRTAPTGTNGLEIQIDEHKLLTIIRAELHKKLIDRDSSNQYENEMYRALLKNLKPGSFGKRNYDSGLNSMSFDKQ